MKYRDPKQEIEASKKIAWVTKQASDLSEFPSHMRMATPRPTGKLPGMGNIAKNPFNKMQKIKVPKPPKVKPIKTAASNHERAKKEFRDARFYSNLSQILKPPKERVKRHKRLKQYQYDNIPDAMSEGFFPSGEKSASYLKYTAGGALAGGLVGYGASAARGQDSKKRRRSGLIGAALGAAGGAGARRFRKQLSGEDIVFRIEKLELQGRHSEARKLKEQAQKVVENNKRFKALDDAAAALDPGSKKFPVELPYEEFVSKVEKIEQERRKLLGKLMDINVHTARSGAAAGLGLGGAAAYGLSGKEKTAGYSHEYYMKNRQRIKQRNKQYRMRNAAKLRLARKRYNREVKSGARRKAKRIRSGTSYITYGGF